MIVHRQQSNMSVFGTRVTAQKRSNLAIDSEALHRLSNEIKKATTDKDKAIYMTMYVKYLIRYPSIIHENPAYRHMLWNKLKDMRKEMRHHYELITMINEVEKIILDHKHHS